LVVLSFINGQRKEDWKYLYLLAYLFYWQC